MFLIKLTTREVEIYILQETCSFHLAFHLFIQDCLCLAAELKESQLSLYRVSCVLAKVFQLSYDDDTVLHSAMAGQGQGMPEKTFSNFSHNLKTTDKVKKGNR